MPDKNEVTKKPVSDFGSKSLNEYLLGSRKMKPFPVAMSLVARYLLNEEKKKKKKITHL